MRQTLLAFCCILICCHPTLAQDKMLERPPFDTIQALLDQGIKQRDLHKQALAWYYWAMHSEQESGLLDSAFQYLNKSVTRFYQAGDTTSAQRARSDLAERVAERGAVAGAIDVHLEALEYFTSRHNLEMETHICARLSRAYDLARDTVKAEYYRRKFKDKNYLLRDTSLDVQVLLQTVEKLHREHRYNIAYHVAFQAYSLAIKAKLPQNQLTYTRLMLGYSAYLDRQYAKALEILKDAERYCHPNDHATRRTIYQRLSQVYEATGNLRNAQYYALRYGTLGDTLLNRDLSRALQLQALQFEDKNIRQAIANLEQEQLQAEKQRKEERLWFGAILFGLGAWMLAAWIFFRDYRHRIHSDRVIAEQNQELSRRYILELEQGQRMETMKGILEGQDSERLRIAQDLHDSVGGMLAATKMQLENLLSRNKGLSKNKDFQNVKKLLDATVLETRHISQNLQPGALKQFGLVNAVRDLTNRLGSTGSTEIDLQYFGSMDDLNPDTALHCYRIIQELLQNSLKHAKAKEILVQLNRTDHELTLLVEDDGVGFDSKNFKKGMGTDNVAQRVHYIGGELSVQTAPGKGTSTLVTIPMIKTLPANKSPEDESTSPFISP